MATNNDTHTRKLLHLISTGARRSQMVPNFPFLKEPTPVMCKCQHVNFEAMDVLEHLWHAHVRPDAETRKRRPDLPDWTKQRLSAWIERFPRAIRVGGV